MENMIAEDARIFRNVRIVNCEIKSGCTIGDDCDMENSFMMEKSELGRRNLIRSSLIRKGTYTGTNSIIKFTEIGKYCSLSWNLSIGGGNHDYTHMSMYTDYWFERTFNIQSPTEQHPGTIDINKYRTHIGNDVWIGAGVQVLSGVTIGDGCVIGAGAIVTKDVPPYSIVTGVPGKVIRKRFSDDIIGLLLRIKWWDWDEVKIIENIELLRSSPSVDGLKALI